MFVLRIRKCCYSCLKQIKPAAMDKPVSRQQASTVLKILRPITLQSFRALQRTKKGKGASSTACFLLVGCYLLLFKLTVNWRSTEAIWNLVAAFWTQSQGSEFYKMNYLWVTYSALAPKFICSQCNTSACNRHLTEKFVHQDFLYKLKIGSGIIIWKA